MFSANWVFRLWGDELREQLSSGFFEGGISFDKDTVYLRFAKLDGQRYTLECKFIEGHLMLMLSDKVFDQSDLRKGIAQFKEIENVKIDRVVNDPGDRWICICLNNQMELWLKGFGKFGNVLLKQKKMSETVSMFRLSLKSDWEFSYPPLASEHWHLSQISQPSDADLRAMQQPVCPTTVVQLMTAQIQFLKGFFFDRNKQTLTGNLEKKIKHLKKILLASQSRLSDIQTKRSNKEIGDLILAHSHSLKPGLTKALVTDYYTDQRIWIKLNPELNAAENAKKYYGKAKNEIIEAKKLLEQIGFTETNLSTAEEQLQLVRVASDFKGLKSFQKNAPIQTQQTPVQDTLPYRIFEHQGYQIWLGKNNKSNDQMLKLSQKNDLWLHAKDVAGSHVIVKKKGTDYPDAVVQFAAQLAAKNSKAKTQNVVPVIYVLRKFVSKPKNAAPGAVSLQKEDIVDAFIG